MKSSDVALHDKVEFVIATRDIDKLIELAKELFSDVFNMSADIERYECILDGSWPSSVEILERGLEKAKNHPNRGEA